MLETREYTLCSPFRANAHNSSFLAVIGNYNSGNYGYDTTRASIHTPHIPGQLMHEANHQRII